MKSAETKIATAVAAVLALAAHAARAADVVCAERERCYGVTKAGKNDCATSTSACAGSAKLDDQKDAWVYLPKGMCEKLTGASLKPPAGSKK